VTVRRLFSTLALLPVGLVLAASIAAAASQGYPVAGVVLDSISGQPLPGILVSLAPDKGGTSLDGRTSSNGQFSFPSVGPGKYILSASGQGYRAQGLNQHDNYFTGISVKANLDARNIVFRLQPDASIRGQVIDDQNEPVRNATAQLFRMDEVDGIRRPVAVTNAGTNDQGYYHFPHLDPGTYYVAISGRPWYAQSMPQSARQSQRQLDPETAARVQQEAAELDVAYPLTFYPDADDSAQASAITLHAGERFTADVTLRAVPAAHLKISGDRPQQGPPPSIMQRIFDGLQIPVFASQGYGFGQSGYEFAGLAPGHYEVEIPGSASENSGGKAGWFRDVDVYGDMEISASDSPAMATVTGLVTYQGAPAPRGTAYFELRNEETGDRWTSQVSDKGLFGLKENELRPGTYQAVLYGERDWTITRIVAQNAKAQGSEISLAPGAAAKVVCTATRVSASVTGTVLQDDQPSPGAMVLLVPDDDLRDKQRYRRDESDSDGTFTLQQVVPGHYTAVAIQNGWNLDWGNPDVLRPYLAKGEKVTVTTEKGANLKLQVQ
jgi:Carboxypeptidase regulatory-like domain